MLLTETIVGQHNGHMLSAHVVSAGTYRSLVSQPERSCEMSPLLSVVIKSVWICEQVAFDVVRQFGLLMEILTAFLKFISVYCTKYQCSSLECRT